MFRSHPLFPCCQDGCSRGLRTFLPRNESLWTWPCARTTAPSSFVRERLGDSAYCPTAMVSEVVGEGVSNFIEGQKLLLHLAKQEYEIVTTGVKERVGGFTPAVAVTDLVQRSFDTFVEMHEEFLKIASKQTHAWLAAVKADKTYDTEGLVEAARDSFDTFVRTQKKFLNVVTEETTKATSGNGAEEGEEDRDYGACAAGNRLLHRSAEEADGRGW